MKENLITIKLTVEEVKAVGECYLDAISEVIDCEHQDMYEMPDVDVLFGKVMAKINNSLKYS